MRTVTAKSMAHSSFAALFDSDLRPPTSVFRPPSSDFVLTRCDRFFIVAEMNRLMIAALCFASVVMSQAAEQVPDFKLTDTNLRSNRQGGQVSPRDYLLQVSGYYFGSAGWGYCRTQFGYLEAILEEVRATKPDLNVEALGINTVGESAYNSLVTAAHKLPWLQDTAEEGVWSKWAVTYRDFQIVDSLGRLRAIYNLTDHDLGNSTNYTALKQILINIAQVADSDGDHLPDDWELLHFGNLSAKPSDDPDHDGFDNMTELAYGTDPLDPQSAPRMLVSRMKRSQALSADMTFRRCAGAWLNYSVEECSDLPRWLDNSALLGSPLAVRNLFNGSGCSEVTVSIPASDPRSFFRLRASPSR
jgi:hypothetical protein